MLDAGLRATELLELTVANARLQEGFLKVLGKGNKERPLPIGRRCQDAVCEWRDLFRPQFDEKEEMAFVFLNANGQRMTSRALEEIIGRSGKYASITSLHPHRLRHTFAIRFLTEGFGDTFQLQQLLAVEPGDGETLRFDRLSSASHPRTPALAEDRVGARRPAETLVRQVQPRKPQELKLIV